MNDRLQIALAQISPVWLNRKETTQKVLDYITQAAQKTADLVVFGEGLLPGYPFWVDQTDGARFNSTLQKTFFSYYADQAVVVERGDLKSIQRACEQGRIATYLGIIERPTDRGGHSLYCSLVYINKQGEIRSVHRKLMPTYEERLVWSIGDGHGLKVHSMEAFTLGGLNCWENWMPLARTSLYAQGEDLHVSVWPGNKRNTQDLLPVLAREGRSYIVGVSGLFGPNQLSEDLPHYELLKKNIQSILADGGSCVAAPDGSWLIEPIIEEEGLFYTEIDHSMVRAERQNFDAVGHYSRPDVLSLNINFERQGTVKS